MNNNTTPPQLPVISILGPTGSGKTALGIDLAQRWPIEIISVDSALVYKTMDIGTAKPTKEELACAPHHLIDICDPLEAYSAAQFAEDATRLISEIQARNKIPVLLGGTMLYAKALRDGLSALPTADPELRKAIEQRGEELGWAELHRQLITIDPQTANRLAPNDKQRIQRALEVFELTGSPMSSFFDQPSKSSMELLSIGLIPERKQLHQRLAQRFDTMLQQGFLKEVENLINRNDLNPSMTSQRCVGYRQAWSYLQKEIDFDTFREQAIAATRQLAKRQYTWLRSWNCFQSFDPLSQYQEAFTTIDSLLKIRHKSC